MTTNPHSSKSWDLGRFVKTLSYFGAIPILSQWDWFQQWFGSHSDPTVDSRTIANPADDRAIASPVQSVILLVGTTATRRKSLIHLLQTQGYPVRPVISATQTTAGDDVDAIVANWEQPDFLTSVVSEPVKAIICDLESAQGWEPSDRLSTLVQWGESLRVRRRSLFDFSQPRSDLAAIWGALDDVVMGGVSQSGIQFGAAAASFSGVVSTANSGGFASVRTRNFEPALDLSDFDGIELRVKGDGNRYKFMLRSDARWDGVAYCYSFDTEGDRWLTIRIPFSALIPVFRARTVAEATFNPAQVSACQLMLSKFEYDGALNPHFQPGLFQLQVESIQAYRQSPHPIWLVIGAPNASITTHMLEQLSQAGMTYRLIQASRQEDIDRQCLEALQQA